MTPTTTEQTPRAEAIASAVVDDLFTNGFGERGSNLWLMSQAKGVSGTPTYYGGWCRCAVEDRINSAIAEARADERRKVIEEAAALIEEESRLCKENSMACDRAGNITGGGMDSASACTCDRLASAIRALLPQQDKQT